MNSKSIEALNTIFLGIGFKIDKTIANNVDRKVPRSFKNNSILQKKKLEFRRQSRKIVYIDESHVLIAQLIIEFRRRYNKKYFE